MQYLEYIINLIQRINEEEGGKIRHASEIMAEKILAGKSLFIFGASHAGILTEEAYFRAGGLVVMNPIFAKALQLDTQPITFTSEMERLPGHGRILAEKSKIKEGDLVIVHSVSGRNSVSVEFAETLKERGVYVLAITNVQYSKSVTSRVPSGKRLFEVADLVLDNHGEIGDASLLIPGTEQRMGASSTVAGAAILNSLITEIVYRLIENGVETPPVFYSANMDGGDEKNQIVREKYASQIHYEL